MDQPRRPPRPSLRAAARRPWLLAGLLAGLLACRGETAPPQAPGRRAPRRERPAALQVPPPAPSAEAQRLEACVERNLHGQGYDELAPRDARRKLRRLQVRAECQAQPER